MSIKIVGFARTSLLDWDGKVATTLYLQGCNWRCGFCHNPDLVPRESDLDEVPLPLILEYLEANREFLDGVVVTGGEPTIHPDLPELIRALRATGMKVKLDTNGSNPEMLSDLIDEGLLDYVAMDIKAPLNQKYAETVRVPVDLERVKRSIAMIMDRLPDYEFRTTVVPFYLKVEDVESIAAFIGGAKKYALHQFGNKQTLDVRLGVMDPYPESVLREMAERARLYVKKVVIRGTG